MTPTPLSRRSSLRLLGAGALPAALAGCGVVGTLTRPQATPTAVPQAVFEIEADATLNPDSLGTPKPVLLRLYELRAAASFERASFLDLQDKDETQLGQDFVRRQELLVVPGERRRIERQGDAEVSAFGWFAAYRDLERSTWRAVVGSPNSVEMRRRWFGLGPTERLRPIHYRVTVARDVIRVQRQAEPS